MNWSEATVIYIQRLRVALNIRQMAQHVADLPAADVPDSLCKTLCEGYEPLERQLRRLEAGEFRIAVVGLEKSGKSTFVNAWLAYDLLPTDTARCTYTTTQIFSVDSEQEQRIEVETKSRTQFDSYLAELDAAAQGGEESAKRARSDRETIRQHNASLLQIVDTRPDPIRFSEISQIGESLRRYVADVSVAHAINEVRLFTVRLARANGIVFYDVPGLNSGLGKHLDESREMLADCDAVICIQRSLTPSLEAHEQKLVEFVAQGDARVGIAAKLFVFAGQIDLIPNATSLAVRLGKLKEEWRKWGNLPDDHIIDGSAAAHLLLTGAASQETCKHLIDANEMRGRLAELRGLNGVGNEQLIKLTGINAIQERIMSYLNEERVDVLRRRCDIPIATLIETAKQIYQQARQRHPIDPDDARRQLANDRYIRFAQWFGERWQEIEPAINRYYVQHFDGGGDQAEPESVTLLRQRYQQLVADGLKKLRSLDAQRREDIFDRAARPAFGADVANNQWRQELYDKDIQDFLREMAKKLSLELVKDTRAYVIFMTEQLWGSSEVEARLLANDSLQERIETGLRTLFLRFARPVAEALIRGPLGSDMRKEIIRKLGSDMRLLDGYYQGEESAFETLTNYVRYGRALLNDPVVRAIVLKIDPRVRLAADALALIEKGVTTPQVAHTEQDVINEVMADLNAFEVYLNQAVFDAAGFMAVAAQELKDLRDRFVRERDTWAGVARIEFENQNPRMLSQLPPALQSAEFDVEVSERLRQLHLALSEATWIT